jgi:hypothetical protein
MSPVSDEGQMIHCPRCTVSDVRASHRPEPWDRVLNGDYAEGAMFIYIDRYPRRHNVGQRRSV